MLLTRRITECWGKIQQKIVLIEILQRRSRVAICEALLFPCTLICVEYLKCCTRQVDRPGFSPRLKHYSTKIHYSRMRTACLLTFRVLVVATRYRYCGGGGIASDQVWTGLQWRSSDVSSMGVRIPTPPWTWVLGYPPLPLLMICGSHHWRPVQTCSQVYPPTPIPSGVPGNKQTSVNTLPSRNYCCGW